MRVWLKRGLAPLAVLVGVVVGVVHEYWNSSGVSVHTVTVGMAPSYIAVDSRTSHVFVTNSTSNSVSMLNTEAVQATVPIGGTPLPVAVAERANRAFVLNSSGNSVSVLDATTGMVLSKIPLPYPIDAAVDDTTGHVFVLHGGCGTAYHAVMLDAQSGHILHTALLAGVPVGIAIDTRVQRVFIANSGNNTVNILDTVSGRLVHTVAVGAIPVSVALDTEVHHAFVTNRSDNTVSVIDARSGAVLRTVAVGQSPTSVAVDTRTARVFVVNAGDSTVSVLDADTGTPLHTATVGQNRVQGVSTAANPVDIVVDTRHGWVYILNGSSLTHEPTWGSVSVLNATSGAVRRTIPVGLFPQGEALDEARNRLFVVNEVGGAPRGGIQSWQWLAQGVRHWHTFLAPPQPLSTHGAVAVLDTSRL